MNTIHIKTKSASESVVVCKKNVLKGELPALLQGRSALLFTDENVLALYGGKLKKYLPGVSVYAMPAGEEHKTAETLFALLKEMAKAGLNRKSVLIALGGGVVGDIGGLAASLYMRGIDCIQVPTTLLSQVDSSVGGKTAIDFGGVKNLVGAFYPPVRVLVDNTFLGTLPPRELRCGLGEIIKHGGLNGELFNVLIEQDNLFDLKFLGSIVPKNIAIKAEVVKQDPTETGLRKCLNLGHTTAHALELQDGTLSHGEYVLIGILYEARIAKQYLPCDGEYLTEIEKLCRRVLDCDVASFDVEAAAHLARLDKKNTAKGKVVLTVPVKKGEWALLELPYEEYERSLKDIRKALC